MHEPILQSGWESFLYGAPILGLLLMSIFKLDVIASAPKTDPHKRRVSGNRADGEPLGCDPDGRPWHPHRQRERARQARAEEISRLSRRVACRKAGLNGE